MSDSPAPAALGGLSPEESEKLQEAFKDIATRSQKLLQDFSQRYQADGQQPTDPLHLTQTFMDFTAKMLADPNRLVQAQIELWQQYMKLWQVTAQRMMGQTVEPVAEPARGDKRFNDPAWKDEVVFDYLKQSYLLTARWLQGTIKEVEGVDDKTAKKVDFYTRQFIDAVSPSNFAVTNPQVVKATVESKGENLLKGLQNLLGDLERGKGRLEYPPDRHGGLQGRRQRRHLARQGRLPERHHPAHPVRAVDRGGLRDAAADRAAVDQQVLHPRPQARELVHQVGDRAGLHGVRGLLGQSRRAPRQDGVRGLHEAGPARRARRHREGDRATKVSAIGYCIGGTLMAATLAYMAARGDDRIAACTFFTAQVDFSEPGELGVFIDEDQLASVEEMMGKKGYLEGSRDGHDLQHAARQRPHLVVRREQLPDGQGPLPLRPAVLERRRHAHAGGDAQLLPAQHVPEEPAQSRRAASSVDNVPIDLRKITIPVYIQAGKEDHIAPSRSVYKATQIFSGPVRFMLAGSGHIAGVVNPPRNKKYQHWLNETDKNPPTLAEWQAGAQEFPGSWWHDWDKWLSALSGPKVPARVPGTAGLPAIEDAPGSYVKVRSGE